MRRPWAAGTRARSIAIGALALIAGCFSDRGLGIEVDVGGTGAARVELYLGKTRCDSTSSAVDIDCSTIAPPSLDPIRGGVAMHGNIWFRDGLLPYGAAVTGRTAEFRLQADAPTRLPIVVAVGLVNAPGGPRAVGVAVLRDLEIPASGARVATIALAPAAPVVPGAASPSPIEDRALVWSKMMPPSSCVVVEHWDHGQVTRDFVVPIEDPDCDDVSPECNPAAYHGTADIGGAAPECIASEPARCVLGNFGCADDRPGEDLGCVARPPEVCVPEKLCGCALEGECTRAAIDGDPLEIPHVDCTVPTTMAFGICGGHDSAEFDLSPEMFDGCGQDARLASLQMTDVAASHKFGAAAFELSGAGDRCGFRLTWKSGAVSASQGTEHGFIVLDSGLGGVLLPIVLQFNVSGCLSNFECHFADYALDSMWSCVRR